jgi:hypothetical protein
MNNEKYEYHTLTPDDLQDLADLIQSRTSFVGIPKTEEQRVKAIQQATIAEAGDLLRQHPSVAMVLGATCEGRLAGALITFSSPNQPCWFLRTAYVAPSQLGDVVSSLLDFATSTYESLGFKRFYAMYTEKSFERYTRLNHRTSVMNRYVGNTDLVVEPNTRPKFLDYWEYLYGRMLLPERTLVRGFNLVDDTMSTFAEIGRAK